MSDTLQIIGCGAIVLILIKEYICAYKMVNDIHKEAKKDIEKSTVESIESALKLMLYYDVKMFILSIIAVLILGVMLF